MKRDKMFLVFIVFISFAVTGVLHYTRSHGVPQIDTYLNAQESSLSVFGEGNTNEFYSLNSQLKTGIENSIPVVYFIEEQQIIEEFSSQKQIKPIVYCDIPQNYLSLTSGMKLVTDYYIFDNTPQLQKRNKNARARMIYNEGQEIRMTGNKSQYTHTIVANDNLYNLAKKYYKDVSRWIEIYQANKSKIADPHSLKIGQELLIPDITVSI